MHLSRPLITGGSCTLYSRSAAEALESRTHLTCWRVRRLCSVQEAHHPGAVRLDPLRPTALPGGALHLEGPEEPAARPAHQGPLAATDNAPDHGAPLAADQGLCAAVLPAGASSCSSRAVLSIDVRLAVPVLQPCPGFALPQRMQAGTALASCFNSPPATATAEGS